MRRSLCAATRPSSTAPAVAGASLRRHKRSGKPNETPEHKQAYLPYETAPTPAELQRERQRFAKAPWQSRLVDVKDVPANMYTYGKEGMTVPIALFKDQPDPVIGPEWTYPGIYENKVACRLVTTGDLFEKQAAEDAAANANTDSAAAPTSSPTKPPAPKQPVRGGFDSPWQKLILDNRVRTNVARLAGLMAMMNQRHIDIFHKERGASGVKKAATTGTGAPATGGAAAGTGNTKAPAGAGAPQTTKTTAGGPAPKKGK